MLINLYKFKGAEYPEDYSTKIDFYDKSNSCNPFADINHMKLINLQTPDEIFSTYLKILLISEIKNIHEKVILDACIYDKEHDSLYTDVYTAANVIKETLLKNYLDRNVKLKNFIVGESKSKHNNAFIETENIYDNYKIFNQFQWLLTKHTYINITTSTFIYLSSKISLV